MAKIWTYGMILFIGCGLILGNSDQMMSAMMDSPFLVIELMMSLVLSGCLWGGFLKIIEESGFMNYFSFLLRPLLKFIYGDVIYQDKVYEYISTNVIANMLGMGTLASVSGLRAFSILNKYNKHKRPSREMLTLVIFNTAGFTLFPSSILMLRHDFESVHLYAFYPYMIVISIIVLIIGIFLQRIIDHE